jgi:hypothetical protein
MQVVELAQQFRDELEALDEEALLRISQAYARIFRNLQGSIDALMLEIASLDNPTQSQIFKLERYRRLINQITDELTTFQAYLRTEILSAAELSFATNNRQAQALLAETLAGITTQFGNLPTDAFEVLVGFLKEGSPLYARIDLLAETTAEYVRQTLLEGVALGRNPRTVASLIGDAFGRGLTDALRLARTAQLYAGRVATLANYQNNSDVLDGWVWFAQIGDPSTCQSCIVQHGTIHPLDELLNDHHNGRCAMIPYIEEFGNPVDETGISWFERQSEAEQKRILGPGKFEAWKAGQFTLDQLSRDVENDVYGDMKSVTPLKDLIP